jgi:hypothetical protein
VSWNTILDGIVQERGPSATPGFSVIRITLGGERYANGLVDAVTAAYRDERPAVTREQLEEMVNQKVALLRVSQGAYGAGSIQSIAGAIFQGQRGLAILPKGKRTQGLSLEASINDGLLLAVATGYASEAKLAADVLEVRATLPEVAKLTTEHLAALPKRGRSCSLAVFGTYPFVGERRIPGSIGLCYEYDPEDDIVENVMIIPPGHDAVSEHGSCYGRNLLEMPVGVVVGFEPISFDEAIELTDRPYAETLRRLRPTVTTTKES